MGRAWRVALLTTSPVFADRMRVLRAALAPAPDWSLEDVAARRARRARRWTGVDVVQPALFAVDGLAGRAVAVGGVEPAAVVGHSQGEIAAAYVAGGLSLEDAAGWSPLRSRALARSRAGAAWAGGAVARRASRPRLDARRTG